MDPWACAESFGVRINAGDQVVTAGAPENSVLASNGITQKSKILGHALANASGGKVQVKVRI
jgi:hypothetical protein